MIRSITALTAAVAWLCVSCATDLRSPPRVTVEQRDGAHWITAQDGRVLRVTAYGDAIVRLQSARPGETMLPDNHYEMVASHDWPRSLAVSDTVAELVLSSPRLQVHIDKRSLAVALHLSDSTTPLLQQTGGVRWSGSRISASFEIDEDERFAGLGHGYFGRADSVDLTGQVIARNYGREQIEQAPLIVPFYMSSRGYGVFLNSTFPNEFRFAASSTRRPLTAVRSAAMLPPSTISPPPTSRRSLTRGSWPPTKFAPQSGYRCPARREWCSR